jgi:hypothetical protein
MQGSYGGLAGIMRAVPVPERPGESRLLSILSPILEMSMLKKLVPAVLGALLIASPVIAVTTAAAAPQAAAASSGSMKSDSMKSTHKAAKHKKSSHHAKHSKKKAPPAA